MKKRLRQRKLTAISAFFSYLRSAGSMYLVWYGGICGANVARLGSVAIFGRAMLLVWAVLQHTDALCCLFGQS